MRGQRRIVTGMTALVLDAPAYTSADTGDLDAEPLTAVYVAPQACLGAGAFCFTADECCPGLKCFFLPGEFTSGAIGNGICEPFG
jgi:hypothetical protein